LIALTNGANVMDMIRANAAEVFWDTDKNAWIVRVTVGEEAVKRMCKGTSRDADEDTLRSLAVQTASDEGYELAAADVSVKR
jgi:hypothetical protein